MASVTFDKASRIYPGTSVPAVDALDLTIDDGEFLVLVGPSGCGKSTSLRMLAGLEEINDGRILIGDRDVTDVAPKDRDIAMVFQNYALYPHMTVAENMGFGLKMTGHPKAEIAGKVAEAARILNSKEEAAARPKQEIRVDYEIGDQVKVLDGPFASFNGLVEELDFEKARVKVSVSIFGRATPVELDFEQVERMK